MIKEKEPELLVERNEYRAFRSLKSTGNLIYKLCNNNRYASKLVDIGYEIVKKESDYM